MVSVVRPIPKNGAKEDDTANYSQVVILSILSHILEKYISTVIINFSCKHSLLSETQYCFRQGKSTTLLLEDFIIISLKH